MICDSLTHHPMPCPRGTIDMNSVSTPALASYNGIITAFLICLTIIILAFIVKCLLIKLNERNQVSVKLERTDCLEKNLQKKFALMDRLLAFEEYLAKNGSNHKEEEARYRTTIMGFISEMNAPVDGKPQTTKEPE